MKENNKENVIQRILERTPFETKLKVALEMHDYDNWENGEYNGDAGKYVDVIIKEFDEYLNQKLREKMPNTDDTIKASKEKFPVYENQYDENYYHKQEGFRHGVKWLKSLLLKK